MSRMLREYLKIPFKLVLLTDEDASGAEVDEIKPGLKEIEDLKLVKKVNCFRRLRLYDPSYTEQFGTEWVMSVDLDTLIQRDITGLISDAMEHPFGLWILRGRNALRGPNERPYNGALQLIRHGAHPQVWETFHPVDSPQEIAKTRWVGSDQSWIGLKAPNAPTFGMEHGVYYFGLYRVHRNKPKSVPACMVNYAGPDKPWAKQVKRLAPELHKAYMRWM